LELRDRIESHFRYFWENDRTAVLLKRKEFFDSIPFRIQQHIMCKFLFQDIFTMSAFKTFFKAGKDIDANFLYEVAFGFMPRQFKNIAEERYIYEEENDVTEIYFIIRGEYAIAFNSYYKFDDNQLVSSITDEELKGPADMYKNGYLIAQKRSAFGYIGDYYVLSSKRSQFHYVAIGPGVVESYALTKDFLYNTIFKKFPGLH